MPEAPGEGSPYNADGQRTISLTLKQMGAWSAVNLRGVDASRTLAFSVRNDEVVVAARLRFAFDFSPALIPELSHLRVLLNERVVDLASLRGDKELGNARDVSLDPRLFRNFNTLRFHAIEHYTRQCEDPFHSSLWLTINDLSRLELTLAPAPKPGDLKHLPAPFLDKADNAALKLPFVFAGTPSLGAIRAAGVTASWFGMQAGSRGVQFPVHTNALPNGNAVVFLEGNDKLAGIKPNATDSSISLQQHPTNPTAKLLVIAGSNAEEINKAARALALLHPMLSGQELAVAKETPAAPRKPYDAPAWIPTDRPVRFGELSRPEELRVQGYYPETIRLNYRAAPDIFAWHTPGAPVTLKYRAVQLPLHKNSSLNIGQNFNFIGALALNADSRKADEPGRLRVVSSDANSAHEDKFSIPPYTLGGRNQLQFSYFFDVIKEGECHNLPPDNLQASIDPESIIDLSGFPHYVALPNLAYFADLGFPYTRLADLSETAVVLPAQPNPDEISLYLTVMGRMGEATGYPTLRHEVVASGEVEKMAARDLIVIGSASDQGLLAKWADYLPIVKVNGERRSREPAARWFPTYRWEQQDVSPQSQPQGKLNLLGSGDLAALMAFESPLQAQRSVVFLYADKSADLPQISNALTNPDLFQIQGDVAVVDEKSVDYAKVSPTYYLGTLPTMSKLRWFFSDQPLLAALLAILVCAILAVAMYRPLRRLLSRRQHPVS